MMHTGLYTSGQIHFTDATAGLFVDATVMKTPQIVMSTITPTFLIFLMVIMILYKNQVQNNMTVKLACVAILCQWIFFSVINLYIIWMVKISVSMCKT